MKQRIFLSFITIAFSILTVSAQTDEKLIINTGNVEHITIANDMSIVLAQGAGDDRYISLDANAAQKLGMKLSNNILTISSVKQPARNKKLTVYLYVNNLKTITVGNNTTVKTMGVLNTPALDVFVDGIAMVHLKTKGGIKAYSLNDAEISVKYLSENLLTRQAALTKK